MGDNYKNAQSADTSPATTLAAQLNAGALACDVTLVAKPSSWPATPYRMTIYDAVNGDETVRVSNDAGWPSLVIARAVEGADVTHASGSGVDPSVLTVGGTQDVADQRITAIIDTDVLLAGNLDTKVASQKAIKTYVDVADLLKVDKTIFDAPATRAYGSALITNGTFTGSATGWTLGGGAAYASNALNVVAGATAAQNIAVTAGVTYNITIAKLASNVDWAIGSESGTIYCSQNSIPTPGRATFTAKATGTLTLTFTFSATDVIDTISMRAITAGTYPAIGGASLAGRKSNMVFGYSAQANLSSGLGNTAIGYSAQGALTTGFENVAVGGWAQNSMTNGGQNTAIGCDAQQSLTTGLYNTAVGCDAQTALTTSRNNTAIGTSAQSLLTTGAENTTIGADAHYGLLTGGDNVAIGYGAGYYDSALDPTNAVTSLSSSVAIGAFAGLASPTQSDGGVAIGYSARWDADNAVAIGREALSSHAGSVAVGYQSATSAIDQVAIGARHIELAEMTAPGAAPSNGARLYAVDNGSGKTQLAVVFASGAVQILATQP